MRSFSRSDLSDLFMAFAARMAQERPRLGALDGEIGDADHGVAMADGFDAAARALQRSEDAGEGLADGLTLAARAFLNAVGATTGPLYASALMRAAEIFGAQTEVPFERLPELIVAIHDGIEARGHGKPGDKTMLDTWGPAAHVAARGLPANDPVGLLRAAAEAGAKGAEDTRAMMAARGRAARLGARSIGHLDPGAVSAAALLEVLADWAARHRGAT